MTHFFRASLRTVATFACLGTFVTHAMAAEPAPATIDFARQQLALEGIFRSAKSQRRSGLDAELEARKEGIARLRSVLERSCGGAASFDSAIMPDWQTSFRSQGSVIHVDHTLRLMLQAPLKAIFKELPAGKPLSLKEKEGKAVIFKVPQIAAETTACGLVQVKLGTAVTKAMFMPAPNAAGAAVIELRADSTGALAPAGAENQALLDASDFAAQLAQLNGQTPVLPVR